MKRVTTIVLCCLLVFLPVIVASAEGKDTEITRVVNCAYIMQGNTTDESDCNAFYNGLYAGGYTSGNLVACGWTRTSSGGSTMNTNRVTASQYTWGSGNYTVSYYSGHGSKSTGYPVINANASTTSGNWSNINVASAIGVNTSNWMNTCTWGNGLIPRVHILAACHQLDSTIMKYYARGMLASGMRVVAGYHSTGPTHPTDTSIVNSFFTYASAGNSVWYSWQHANQDYGSHPWAVLVYTSNNNQYYRIPGFPGNTYSDPTAGSSIYRYASHLNGGNQVVPITSSGSVNRRVDEYPLYIHLENNDNVDINIQKLSFRNRETVDAEDSVAFDPSQTNQLMQDVLSDEQYRDAYLRTYYVDRCEVDPDYGYIDNSDIIIQQVYCYHNTYQGLKIDNSFVEFDVDCQGISHISSFWKDAIVTELTTSFSRITEEMAIQNVLSACEEFNSPTAHLIYHRIDDDTCKLFYEIVEGDCLVYVDAETGDITY